MQNLLLFVLSMLTVSLRSVHKFALVAVFTAVFSFAGFAAAQGAEQVDVTIQMVGPTGPVTAGSTIEYILTGRNTGPDTAFDVTTTFNIPTGLTYNAALSNPACVPNGSQVHCHVLSLPLNAVKEYRIKFDVSTNTNFCNQQISANASISTSSTETNPQNNQASTSTTTIDCTALQADVSITKSEPPTVQFGDTLFYQLTVNNNGPGEATAVTASDTVPSGLVYNQGQSSANCVLNGSTVHCGVNATVASGASETFTVAFHVNDPVSCNRDIVNQASVSTSSTDPNPSNNMSNTVRTRVQCPQPKADLSLEKGFQSHGEPGDPIFYQLFVINNGPDAAATVKVIDDIPNGLVFNAAASDSACQKVSNQIICENNTPLNVNSTIEFQVTFDIPQNAPCGTVYRNTATVSSTTNDPNMSNNTGEISKEVTCPPETVDVRVTKTGPNAVTAGNVLRYSVLAENLGPATAKDITVSDVVPQGLQFNASASSNECVLNGNTVHCGQFDLAANAQPRNLTIAFNVPTQGLCGSTIQNQASISTSSTDTNSSNNLSSTTSTTVDCPSGTATITKTADKSVVAPHEEYHYTIRLQNSSAQPVTVPLVTDELPFQVLFKEFTTVTSGTPSNEIVVNGGAQTTLVKWENILVPANGTATLSFRVKMGNVTIDGDTITNTATIQNGPSSSVTVLVHVDSVDLSITKNASKNTVSPNEVFDYTIDVHNNGNQTITNVSVLDALPSSVTFESFVNHTSGTVAFGDPNFQWNNIVIAPNQTVSATFSVRANSSLSNGTSIVNTAQIVGGPSASVTTAVTVGQPTFAITKTDGETTASPNDILVYTIVVTNTSTTNASNVQVVDILPNNVQFISAAGASVNGQTVTWNGLSINAGGSKTLNVSAQVSASATAGTTLTNTAQVTGGPIATDDTSVVVTGTPVLTITKTDNRSTAQIGDVLTYNIIITNISTVHATNVSVEDTVPSQLSVINATNPGVLSGQKVTWSGLSIAAGGQLPLTISAQVRTGTPNNTTLSNTAQIIGGNSATDTTLVQGGVVDPHNITIDLTDLRDPVEPDETFCYNIRLTNLNSGPVDTLTVTQSLDGQTTYSSASDSGSRSGNSVRWTNISIPANGTRNLGSCVRVDEDAEDGDTLRSTAFVGNKSDDEHTDVGDDDDRDGDCRISSIDDNPDPVRAGETLTYNIRIRNERNRSERFNIRAYLDGNVSFLSASDGGDDVGTREVEWDDFRISGDETDSVRLTVRVRKEASNGETIRIRVDCEDDDDVESTRVEGGTTPPGGNVSASVQKQASKREAKPGDTVFYTITVRNNTSRTANDVSIQDRFTTGSISIEDAGGGRVAGNGINWTIPTLRANASQSYTYRIRIGKDMRHGQIISNTVRVSSPNFDRDATDIEEVRVITDLPQTGLGGFFTSWKQSNQYLRPSSKTANTAFSGTTGASGVWIAIISIGILTGGILGRKFLS